MPLAKFAQSFHRKLPSRASLKDSQFTMWSLPLGRFLPCRTAASFFDSARVTKLQRGARQDSSLPHECGVPVELGTPHSCGSEESCRAPVTKLQVTRVARLQGLQGYKVTRVARAARL